MKIWGASIAIWSKRLFKNASAARTECERLLYSDTNKRETKERQNRDKRETKPK
jgi:hypothetical protein